MISYHARYRERFASKFDDEQDFRSEERAREHDRELAIALVTETPADAMRMALRNGGAIELKKALAYLAEEIDISPGTL